MNNLKHHLRHIKEYKMGVLFRVISFVLGVIMWMAPFLMLIDILELHPEEYLHYASLQWTFIILFCVFCLLAGMAFIILSFLGKFPNWYVCFIEHLVEKNNRKY